ncbi:TerC/Alx family metal homeostasis membrane protein [Actinocrinis puniceicyclus]|uniref:TerC/Alx family metal homeostasis membrane protein n=1 Tax=Actinocrinis puniceicyclus TaxID=977794 RepID=A0A8J7WJU8_9ACTN|nr:TerC/Alx family metal homeostasis membrane protein [Actinocrinis puniceicyclus]MBS2962658.1 TerC/Alx family metal homeostasis membrane protein [Actinocrinis puniceicyclus]
MSVPVLVWAATVLGLLAVLALDLFVVGRAPHAVSLREAGTWVAAMAALAVAFGLGLSHLAGTAYGGQFFAGWITEYSLSVDNLFVFVIILSRFRVPRDYQHRVLLVGVLVALGLRGVFIGLGSAIVSTFDWVFYLFGAFLVYTAVKLAAGHGAGPAPAREIGLVRFVRRIHPTVDDYHGTALTARVGAVRALTPMALVILAVGAADLLFALDSIPAVFGLTQQPYIVFTANAFALLGLRQLYFLIGGLLDRLVYLSVGLSVVLGFIGLKMIVEALHGSGVENLGPVALPTVSIPFSLGVIVLTLAVTTVLSLTIGQRRAREQACVAGTER